MKKGIKISLWILALLGVGVLITTILTNNKEKAQLEIEKELQPIAYKVDAIKIKLSEFSTSESYQGIVEPITMVTALSEAEGRVTECNLVKGSKVEKGAVLACVNKSIRSATHNINRLTLEKAKADYAKFDLLYKEGNYTKAELENLANQVAIAEQQFKISETQLNQTCISAPISGIIVDKKVNIGDNIQVANPIATIADLSKVIIKLYLPEKDAVALSVGDSMNMVSEIFPTKKFFGKVKSIIPIASESKTYPVELEINNTQKPMLMAGMRLQVSNKSNAPIKTILIPRTALVGDFSKPMVFTIDATKKVKKRAIQLGREFDTEVEVLSGIAADEILVINGQQNMVDGSTLSTYTIK